MPPAPCISTASHATPHCCFAALVSPRLAIYDFVLLPLPHLPSSYSSPAHHATHPHTSASTCLPPHTAPTPSYPTSPPSSPELFRQQATARHFAQHLTRAAFTFSLLRCRRSSLTILSLFALRLRLYKLTAALLTCYAYRARLLPFLFTCAALPAPRALLRATRAAAEEETSLWRQPFLPHTTSCLPI